MTRRRRRRRRGRFCQLIRTAAGISHSPSIVDGPADAERGRAPIARLFGNISRDGWRRVRKISPKRSRNPNRNAGSHGRAGRRTENGRDGGRGKRKEILSGGEERNSHVACRSRDAGSLWGAMGCVMDAFLAPLPPFLPSFLRDFTRSPRNRETI